jgi:hypothetical protein
MKRNNQPVTSSKTIAFLFIPVLILVLFSVVMNSLSVYVTKAQQANYSTAVWFILPILDLLYMLGIFWIQREYRSMNQNSSTNTILIIIGLAMLVVPLVPSIAIHLDLPWNVPYLQVTGAFLTLLPFLSLLLK